MTTTWQMTNVLTGAPEGPKYTEVGTITEIWTVAVTTSLGNGDTLSGPVIPAGTYLQDVVVDTDDLDSATSITFECGYTGHLAAFIATSNTTMQTGGIQHANVKGTVGFTASTNTTVLITITAAAGTPVAGTVRLMVTYTANP